MIKIASKLAAALLTATLLSQCGHWVDSDYPPYSWPCVDKEHHLHHDGHPTRKVVPAPGTSLYW